MDKPTNALELTCYFLDHPMIRRENGKLWTFIGYRNERIWLKDELGLVWYLEIPVENSSHDTTMTFHDDRFEVTRHGNTNQYFYHEKDDPDHQKDDA